MFGAVRSSSGSGSTEYRFTGQQDDATLGYTYLRARYYDPYTGRFLSKDPFPGVLANPASLHYYAYAQNNPVNWADPSGKFLPILPGIVAVATWLGMSTEGLLIVSGGILMLTSAAVLRSQDQVAAVGESCGAAIRGAVDNAGLFLSGGAGDKSISNGVKGKAAEGQKDKDQIAREPNSQAVGHWEGTSGGLEEAIDRDLERLGPEARKEAKEFLAEEYPDLLGALE